MNTETKTILVVDDDVRYLELMEFALQSEGYVVVQTADPERVQLLAAAEKPDAIIMDVAMPAMDGITAAIGLKSDPLTADIPLIFATARGLEPDKFEGWNVGAVEYLTKPFSVTDLVASLKRVLEKSSRETART